MLYSPEFFTNFGSARLFEDRTESTPEKTTDPAVVAAQLQKASTEEQKLSIAQTWLQEFTALSDFFRMAQRCSSVEGVEVPKKLAKTIFSDDISIERSQLFSRFFAKRSSGCISRMICFLQKSLPHGHYPGNPYLPSYNFRTISNSELKIVLAMLNIYHRDDLDIMERLARINQLPDFYLEKTPTSDDRMSFINIFRDYLWIEHHNEYYLTDEAWVKFFKILQMPNENFQGLLKIKESISEKYFKFFILCLVKRYSTDEINTICDSTENELLNAMPYLILIEGLDTLAALRQHFTNPLIQNFIQKFREHELLKKDYSATVYTRGIYNEAERYLNDFSWDIQTLERLSQRSRQGVTLFSALSQLIAKSEGAALRTLKQCLAPKTERQLIALEAMVFDHPVFCTELQYLDCTLSEEDETNNTFDLEEHFVTFSRYDNKEMAKRVLEHPAIARLCLFNPGPKSDHYQTLVQEGIFDVLLDAEKQSLQTLPHLLKVPDDEDGMDNYFFCISTLLFAHKTVLFQENTLLWTILTTDPSRFCILNQCIQLFEKQYGVCSSFSDYGTLCIKITQDMIECGLMQSIFLLVPANLPCFEDLHPAGVMSRFIDDWKPMLKQLTNKLQLVTLNMLINVIGTAEGAQSFIWILAHQKSVEATLQFFADKAITFIDECKDRIPSSGLHNESLDERVLKYLLENSNQTQLEFKEEIIQIGRDLSELHTFTNEPGTTPLL